MCDASDGLKAFHRGTYDRNSCINMLLVIGRLPCSGQAARCLSLRVAPLPQLPAAELEASPSLSWLMNAAARSASSVMSASL